MIFRNLIFFLIIFLCGCGQKDRVYQYKDYIFGTIIDIKIYGETENKSKQITNLIFDDFQRLHNYLHPWEKSLISDMNHAISTGESFTIDDAEIIRVLKENTELSQKTDNFFNPAMGKLIALWGFHEDNIKQSIPSSSVIKDFVTNMPLMEDLTITNNTVSSKNKKFQLDLGGYAKGYALDRAKLILQNNNIKIALSDPYGSGLYNYYQKGEMKSEGNSITEGIGQGRITKNLENCPIDMSFRVDDNQALTIIFELLKEEGLFLGGSSGINVAGAIKLAKELGPGHTIVTILCDSGQRYQSKIWNPSFLKSKDLVVPHWL